MHESVKAAQLSEWFDLRIPPSLVCCSHTPMQSLLPQYRHSRTLVIGMTDVKSVAQQYGFKDVVSVADLFRSHTELVPHLIDEDEGGGKVDKRHQHTKHSHRPLIDLASIELIAVMHDPVHW